MQRMRLSPLALLGLILVGCSAVTEHKPSEVCAECDPGKNEPGDLCGIDGRGTCVAQASADKDAGPTLICSLACAESEPASMRDDCPNDFACK